MLKQLFLLLQYLIPQHLLSRFMGKLAESRILWLKNAFIRLFIKAYKIDLRDAIIENPDDFPTFNSFFIRQLKPQARPIAAGKNMISPVDGTLTQQGQINQTQLLQAKNKFFTLESLLVGDTQLISDFRNGSYAILYLAPHNYHRVHMPLSGKLEKTFYVPGKLFSVNQMTSQNVLDLFSRNERLITLFKTEAGPMAVILVGAMIVGSIQTVWMEHPIRAKRILSQTFTQGIELKKGAELGYFKMGSTVILLFAKDKTKWLPQRLQNPEVQFGQEIGTYF